MKTKLLVILCVMIFAGAAMVGPVAGADTGQSIIIGNISQVLQLTVEGSGITGWALGQGSNTNSTDVTLHLISNYPTWTITINDNLDTAGGNPKNATTRGKMAESTSGGAYVGDYNLTNAMKFSGTPDTLHYTANSDVILTSGSPMPIYSGLTDYRGAGEFTGMPIIIQQTVTYADPILPSTENYKIIVTFVASVL